MMEHELFPVAGFEFMDEPATKEQKGLILELCEKLDIQVNKNGVWPDPFSKLDAINMINSLKLEPPQ